MTRYTRPWCVGVCAYTTVMAATVYEGIESFIGQSIIAVFFSAALLPVVSFLGLGLRVPPVRRLWRRRVAAAVLIFGLLLFGLCVLHAEIAVDSVDPAVARQLIYLALKCGLSGILLVMFAVAHWPAGLRGGTSPG